MSKNPIIKVEQTGPQWGVWFLWGYNYNGPDWYEPLYQQIAIYSSREEAEQAAAQAIDAQEAK